MSREVDGLKGLPGQQSWKGHPTLRKDKLCRFFYGLDRREARLVRTVVFRSRHPILFAATVLFNHLGNGWLYLAVGIALLALEGRSVLRLLLAASISAGLAHSIYPWIKPRLARVRPCDADPALGSSVKALDEYSCPSGHCMTAAAVGTPLAMTFPSVSIAVLLVWLLIAWSRLSSGHHYPTDLFLGTVIGAGIALPVSLLLL